MKLDIGKVVCDYNVQLKYAPLGSIRASVKKESNHYIVLVNDNLNAETMERAVTHELLHIILGHMDEARDLPETVKEAQVASMMLTLGMTPERRRL